MKPLALSFDDVIGKITPPAFISNIGEGGAGINKFLSNILAVIYIFGSIIFLFMIVAGAVQWITSGGDKEAVQKARSRITNAIIGLVLLALARFIAALVGSITGFNI